MTVGIFALLIFVVDAACGAEQTKLLFVDDALFAHIDPALSLRASEPTHGPKVIAQDRPWESWAVFAYNHVLRVPGEQMEYRMYYDCIEGTGCPPGQLCSLSHRRICVATSTDGLDWAKPELNIFNLNGSTSNNIILEDSGVSVFVDNAPGVPDTERWKLVCSNGAYASADGLHFHKLPWTPIAEDDTKPTAYWDPTLGKYVIYVRRDVGSRCIGRCITTNISDWQESSPGGCPVVFCADSEDPEGDDIYTNAYTPYPSIENPAIHLFFPSFYHHFGPAAPFGFGNDGLLDIRLIYARQATAKALKYSSAINGRAPFVPLGPNGCGPGAASPSEIGGWCNPTTGVEEKTSFDTSATYMASGYAESPDGNEIFFYSSGQPMTHGGDSSQQLWGKNTGIRVNRLRRDGFVAVEAPYSAVRKDVSAMPTFTTVEVSVPSNCSAPKIYNTTTNTTGCSYEFPGNKCPALQPNPTCATHDDCSFSAHPTCHGVVATCQRGRCTTGVVGGDLCVAQSTIVHETGGVELQVNAVTSVAGKLAVEVRQDGKPIPGYTLADAAPIKGNVMAYAATWGARASLSSFAGQNISLRVAMADAKLYSLTLACAQK